MATIERENIGLLNDKIIIRLSKEDYFPTFEKKLKEYSKTVNLPGFRKGMVPTGMIKKMYGHSIYTDEVLKTVEKQLHTYLNAEKPDIFAQPLPLDADLGKLDLNNPSEYEFGFEIGLKPDFEIAPLDKAPVVFNKVRVTDEMVQEEVERMKTKNGILTEPEAIGSDENILNILFTESTGDGIAIERGLRKEIPVILKYFTTAVQEKLKGSKKDDFLLIQLSEAFEGDKLEMILADLGFEEEDRPASDKFFLMKIAKIGLVEKREMNEEFFNEIFPGAGVSTEDEFRSKLKEEIQQYWDSQSRNQLQDQLYHYLLDETRIEFPADFLKRWLQTSSNEPKTAEQAEEEFPVFSGQLKWTLISDKLIKNYDLKVTSEDVENSMKNDVMRYFGTMSPGSDTSWLDSYIGRMLKDEKQVEATYRRLLTDKIFNFAEAQAKPVEKEVTADELTGMQHHHH